MLASLQGLSSRDVVRALIATARDKRATEPGWALAVGHALHASGDAAGTELLGRDAIAQTGRAT